MVHPLGFDTSEKACRRAGLDYWPRLGVREHPSWEHCLAHVAMSRAGRAQRLWLFTTKATRCAFDVPFEPGDCLVFGKETAGLDDAMLARYPDCLACLPMVPQERSLNLATAVCAVVYEGVRQLRARGVVRLDEQGRLLLPGARNHSKP